MSETATNVLLKTHGVTRLPVEVRWERVAVQGSFHGAYFPGTEETPVITALSRESPERQRDIRLLKDEAGWTLLLLSGQWEEPLSPWPLKRIGSGPFLFHPADVQPLPPIPPDWASKIEPKANLLGCVEEGRVEW